MELHVPDRDGRMRNIVLARDAWGVHGEDALGVWASGEQERDFRSRDVLHWLNVAVWKARKPPKTAEASVRFQCYPPNTGPSGNESGIVSITYTLTEANELRVDYETTSSGVHPFGLERRVCWNLGASGHVLNHEFMVIADRYVAISLRQEADGPLRPVGDGPMDFTRSIILERRMDRLDPESRGYDHGLVLASDGGALAFAARIREPDLGRIMEVFTTAPVLRFWTDAAHDPMPKPAAAATSDRPAGFGVEAGLFGVSSRLASHSTLMVRPGEKRRLTTIYRFSVD